MITNKKIIPLIMLILIAIIIGLILILKTKDKEANIVNNNEDLITGQNKLYYLGHASLRIVTQEGKVIYIDPYMGDDYSLSADLVLVTHSHYDHSDVSKVRNRTENFKLITHREALVNGDYKTFDLGYAKIEAVEAGYNAYHNKSECVGYVITLSDNTKIYVAGDTYLTPQMEELGSWNIDYAFFPCDGTFTMTTDEAVEASRKVKAKHNIPYHVVSDGRGFDENVANAFNAENRLIIKPEEEIILTHE